MIGGTDDGMPAQTANCADKNRYERPAQKKSVFPAANSEAICSIDGKISAFRS